MNENREKQYGSLLDSGEYGEGCHFNYLLEEFVDLSADLRIRFCSYYRFNIYLDHQGAHSLILSGWRHKTGSYYESPVDTKSIKINDHEASCWRKLAQELHAQKHSMLLHC